MEDKETLILLGEIKATQHLTLEMLKKMESVQTKIDERVTWVEKKVHYALGVVAGIMFIFQYAWNYMTGKA